MPDQMCLENLPPLVDGYPKLGAYMGLYPEAAIVRKFGSLNLQNVLYLQAELTHLELKLRGLQLRDSQVQDSNEWKFSRDWYWLDASSEQEDCDQFKVMIEIRTKLKEYNEAVLQQAAMAALPDPNQNDLDFLRSWLERPQMGNLGLLGEDRHTWATKNEPISHEADLIALKTRHNQDRFSSWVTDKFVVRIHNLLWHRIKEPSDIESGIVAYDEENLLRYTAIISTVIASLLPILATIILYYVQDMEAKLGLIAIFTLVFALCLTAFTSAKKGEIFTATAAFVAIEVVFVSGNGGITK